MHLVGIELHNWMVFRGRQRLALGPTAYGVVASRVSDPERSNWGGKSALLEAIEFALSGWQNSDRRHGAAGWITAGEGAGGVELLLSGGERITRSRDGKRTELTLQEAPGSALLKGAAAQARIDQMLGMSPQDRQATCYFPQREVARFVLARPEERMGIVMGWLRLEALKVAQKSAEAARDAARAKYEAVGAALARARAQLAEVLGAEELEALAARAEGVECKAADAASERDGLLARLSVQRGQEAIRAQAAEYAAIVEQGKALAAQAGDVGVLTAEHERLAEEERKAAGELEAARAKLAQRRQLARGGFDGKCPVAAIACPVTAEINAARTRAAKLAKEAEAQVQEAAARHEPALAAERAARARLQEAERLAERMEVMRERARKLQPAEMKARKLPPREDAAELEAAYRRATGEASRLEAERLVLSARVARARALQAEIEAGETSPEVVEKHAAWVAEGEAAMLLGKARRRLAEGSLGEIEREANAVLRDAGIDLQFGLRWSREGGSLASTCEACGAPFPASEKVRACGACAAERGMAQVNKLEIEFTDRSGAAEDLVGLSTLLASSVWLRADRGCAWAMAALDEPLSQLDASHRRAVGARLWPMIRAAAFEQAFVISHTTEVLHGLPSRIEIVRDGKYSKVRVAS